MEAIKTIIEPFRIKMVEPIPFTSANERETLLKEANYNLFQIQAQHITIDMLTDSGTSALSNRQWSAMMLGDESYAGASSFNNFRNAVSDIFGFSEVLPVHQGRAAERILFSELVKSGNVIPANAHFDTTRANIERLGAKAVDLPCQAWLGAGGENFLGNIDLDRLELLIEKTGAENIPFVIMTVTSNTCAGQPVSIQNLAQTSSLLKRYGIPLYIDAARFAENAYFIRQLEAGYSTRSIRSIALQMFSYADGALMSCKKDGLANIGGFIALNDKELAEKLKVDLIVSEGFPTYGGLTGRDLETIAVGLTEVLELDYLNYRAASARFLHDGLKRLGIPLINPPALHAVYVDAARMLPHIEPGNFPGQVLVCRLFLEGGIRACEIGTAMFGQTNAKTGKQICARKELVRLALPRRVYTQSHFEYVIEAFANIQKEANKLVGLKIVKEAPALRHFTAFFEPLQTKTNNEEKTETMTLSLNANAQELPENASLTSLVGHLEKVLHIYLKDRLPRLIRLSDKVTARYGEERPELVQVTALLKQLAVAFDLHVLKEEETLFPFIKRLDKMQKLPRFHCGSLVNSIRILELDHEDVSNLLTQIRELTSNYSLPEKACHSYRIFLNGIEEIDCALRRTVHEEADMLFPSALEKELDLSYAF